MTPVTATASTQPKNGVDASIIRIGCAGWGLSSNVADSFPGEGSHLERYANIFSAVEINSSFYRTHQPKTYERWASSVPDDFRFSVKFPRTITHGLRLRDAHSSMMAFLDQVAALGNKLGCLLLQLPPSLTLNPQEANHFFMMMRRLTSVRVVCEPRHPSWFTPAAASLMNAAAIACVRAHPLPVPDVEPLGDPETLYIRLHGAPRIYYSAYDDVFLDAVASRINAACRMGSKVWCLFDNTASGQAIPNALTLMKLLG